ncbi:hypothetical protein P153DRAFT_221298 [Dothidotthia symphoricarpi CBS 119687]|uniref:Uncharacterized protein n=1 Tax=Dothidotthia symphoricarpi CBS 119687 TaxID=1392245 RepID=A0A6A6AH62_9PLEO|nr:uncharacterized protein P153DRAFT_221298 [Dothidotthia symphoricarpi CBS 119687]KAF2130583.1 hypothetical protein P153DRAFT_221298 [Dothidotthia symphoricarpi CBS 119687]
MVPLSLQGPHRICPERRHGITTSTLLLSCSAIVTLKRSSLRTHIALGQLIEGTFGGSLPSSTPLPRSRQSGLSS